MWPFKKKEIETRSSGSGYTSAILSARESWISGQSGLGELTGCVQSCVSLWENGLSIAEVKGSLVVVAVELTSAVLPLADIAASVWSRCSSVALTNSN